MMRLLKDPFIHFLLLGVAAFLIQAFVWGSSSQTNREILVSNDDVERETALWASEIGRMPNDQETETLMDEYIIREVLVREALALELDVDDRDIRRRLVHKMREVLAGTALLDELDEADMRQWFNDNRTRYNTLPARSFRQVFFNPETRGEAVEVDADAMRRLLEAGEFDWVDAGDPFLGGSQFRLMAHPQATALFGSGFATALFDSQVAVWSGPVRSAFGWHLIIVEEDRPFAEAVFEDEIDRVRQDYRQVRMAEATQDAIDDLVETYTVEWIDE